MTKEKLFKSPIFSGIGGGIMGYCLINLCSWSITMGISFYEMILSFIRLIFVPFVLGIISGIVCQKTRNDKMLAFWIAFGVAFSVLPITLVFLGTKTSNLSMTQFDRTSFLFLTQITIGFLIEMLLYSTIEIFKVIKDKIDE